MLNQNDKLKTTGNYEELDVCNLRRYDLMNKCNHSNMRY